MQWDPLIQTRLNTLMKLSSGRPDITIGVIDGPVDLVHPAFDGSLINTVKSSQVGLCKNANSASCLHGTFVLGILSSRRGLVAPAICPNCTIMLYPIFKETDSTSPPKFPSPTPEELSDAIIETINAGAKIINLSLGLSSSSIMMYRSLIDAYEYALQKNVFIVSAAGNQGSIGNISLNYHPWIIPVASCNESYNLDPSSNFGPSIANRGLMAPGANIKSTSPGGGYTIMSGTSFATAFVTATIALLCSIFENTPSEEIRSSLLISSSRSRNRNRTVIPTVLDAQAAYDYLTRLGLLKGQ